MGNSINDRLSALLAGLARFDRAKKSDVFVRIFADGSGQFEDGAAGKILAEFHSVEQLLELCATPAAVRAACAAYKAANE